MTSHAQAVARDCTVVVAWRGCSSAQALAPFEAPPPEATVATPRHANSRGVPKSAIHVFQKELARGLPAQVGCAPGLAVPSVVGSGGALAGPPTNEGVETMTETCSRIARIESAIGSRGGTLSREGTPAERLKACAGYFGGLGLVVAPEESALATALAGLGTDVGSAQFDSSSDAEARAVRVAAEEKSAAEAAALQAADVAAARAAADAQAQAAADAQAAQVRRAALEATSAQLAADAEQKADEAVVAQERADEAAAELAAVSS